MIFNINVKKVIEKEGPFEYIPVLLDQSKREFVALEVNHDKTLYTGEILKKQKEKDGIGVMMYNDSSIYEGQWKEGKV
jgi:hypothetical protein